MSAASRSRATRVALSGALATSAATSSASFVHHRRARPHRRGRRGVARRVARRRPFFAELDELGVVAARVEELRELRDRLRVLARLAEVLTERRDRELRLAAVRVEHRELVAER